MNQYNELKVKKEKGEKVNEVGLQYVKKQYEEGRALMSKEEEEWMISVAQKFLQPIRAIEGSSGGMVYGGVGIGGRG